MNGGADRGGPGGGTDDRPGFFIPYRHAAEVMPCDYPAIAELFAAREADFRARTAELADFAAELAAFGGPPPAPRFAQEWFPRLDGAMAYLFVRRLRPRRIVEIGSGHSTRFMARAIRDGGLACRLLCIDPAPRARLDGLSVEHRACRLEEVEETLFAELAPGDILFVDSSHIAMPGTDVDRILNRILPVLRAGVVVHFHDIFLPDPYPGAWAWRGYNEQLLVAGWLAAGGLEPLFASHWVASRRPEWIAAGPLAAIRLAAEVPESSLWAVRRRGSAALTP